MKKNIRKIIGIIVLILIVIFWALVLFMKDKSPNWCNLSLGTYDVQGFEFVDGGLDTTFGPAARKIYGCQGGIFGFTDKKWLK